jgi:hypothetical protein
MPCTPISTNRLVSGAQNRRYLESESGCSDLTIRDTELVVIRTYRVMKELVADGRLFGGTRNLETRIVLITGSLVKRFQAIKYRVLGLPERANRKDDIADCRKRSLGIVIALPPHGDSSIRREIEHRTQPTQAAGAGETLVGPDLYDTP